MYGRSHCVKRLGKNIDFVTAFTNVACLRSHCLCRLGVSIVVDYEVEGICIIAEGGGDMSIL